MSRYFSLVSLGFVMHSRKWTTSERVRSRQSSMLPQTYSLQCKDFSSENGRGNTPLKLKSVQGQRQINTWKWKDGNSSIFFSLSHPPDNSQFHKFIAVLHGKKKKSYWDPLCPLPQHPRLRHLFALTCVASSWSFCKAAFIKLQHSPVGTAPLATALSVLEGSETISSEQISTRDLQDSFGELSVPSNSKGYNVRV